MNTTFEFKEWPKTPRECAIKKPHVLITEKMDGTNSCIFVENGKVIGCQSRNRIITIEDDNYGFAKWVEENKEVLCNLPNGYNFGEWCGEGINRNPHNIKGKVFFLFDVSVKNPVCDNVRIIYRGEDYDELVDEKMIELKEYAENNNYEAEGIIKYNYHTKERIKYTFKFSKGKWCEDDK